MGGPIFNARFVSELGHRIRTKAGSLHKGGGTAPTAATFLRKQLAAVVRDPRGRPARTKSRRPPAENDAHDMHAGIPRTVAEWARGAMLFDGLGNFHRKATTSSAEAQKFFDQGMRYLWAFNHDESTRSFAKATELDPSCAICYWGVALTVGPNYNVPTMAEPRAKVAWEALGQAEKYSSGASPAEQALIAALAKRYNGQKALDSSNEMPVFTAYAHAMKTVAKKFPNDLDAQTLYAEAMMDLNAWKLWTLDGRPAPGTREILATLESVLKRAPGHSGANHYYIHAVEACPTPLGVSPPRSVCAA
jgi:hypothetical protein